MRIISDRWQEALAKSHQSYTRLELWRCITPDGLWFDGGVAPSGATFVRNLNVVSGSLRHDLSSFVAGSLTATIATGWSGLANASEYDEFATSEEEVEFETWWFAPIHGITYPDGTSEEIRLGCYRLTRIRPGHVLGEIEIEGEDGTTNLTAYPVTSAQMSINQFQNKLDAGVDWVNLANDLIYTGWNGRGVADTNISPGVTRGALPVDTNILNQGRDQLLASWSDLHHGRLYVDEYGILWWKPAGVSGDDAGVIGDGTNAIPGQAVITGVNDELNRADIYNVVVVEWQVPTEEGTDTYVYGEAENEVIGTPAYAAGAFGRRLKLIQDVPVFSEQEANDVAYRHLQETLGRVHNMTVETVANPAYEIGDRLFVDIRSTSLPPASRIIEVVEFPLGPEATMTLDTKLG